MDTWVFYVIGGVLLAGYMVWQWQHNKKKIAHFTQVAQQRGWQYRPKDSSVLGRFRGSPFNSRGHSRRARHVFSGQHRGKPFCCYEYTYKVTSGSGSNRRTQTYYFRIASVSTPATRPTLEISKEGWGSKMLDFVGVRDLQLESVEFNKAFKIKTENDKFAYDVLHPRTMEWMLHDPRAPETPVRFENGGLVTWERGKFDLEWMQPRLDYLCEFVERVPEFVWK
ncbi:hypothetical protein EV191_1011020 [Tamaricihabitans halophyticus]|uniref:DUF3137 domain-containing protein n=1 Tax=Tamaricihabitans halophyticus TaxID=1262583 RepID=A0A4R2R5M4_9PSEU|nr:hypothetical protein [Tamaricihabitans halophyticus]TCP57068.1 hypothetical protein EV191_1011020 [Tamaricihabitans halophyticus]